MWERERCLPRQTRIGFAVYYHFDLEHLTPSLSDLLYGSPIEIRSFGPLCSPCHRDDPYRFLRAQWAPSLKSFSGLFFGLTVSKSVGRFGEDRRALPWVLLGLIISLASVLPYLSKMYRSFQTMTNCTSTFSSPQGPVLETKGMFGARPFHVSGSDSERLAGKGCVIGILMSAVLGQEETSLCGYIEAQVMLPSR